MSAKTVAEKLLIKPNVRVWLSHPERTNLISPLPAGAVLGENLGAASVAIVFADDEAGLRAQLVSNRSELLKPNALWIAYPKGNRIDLNRDSLWPILGEYGLRPITQVAIDDVWSALRFRALKSGEEHFRPAGS